MACFSFIILALSMLATKIAALPSALPSVSTMPSLHEFCRQIDLSLFYNKAGTTILQHADSYNITTYETKTKYDDVLNSTITVTEPIVNVTHFNVSGFATMIDACTFQVDNMTITSVAPDSVWYGKMSSDDGIGKMVSWGSVQATNGSTTQYTFMEGITFKDVNTIILYSRATQTKLASFTFPRKTGGGAGSAGSETGTSTGTAELPGVSSGNRKQIGYNGDTVYLAVLISYLTAWAMFVL
jgi:hypothetical protein